MSFRNPNLTQLISFIYYGTWVVVYVRKQNYNGVKRTDSLSINYSSGGEDSSLIGLALT